MASGFYLPKNGAFKTCLCVQKKMREFFVNLGDFDLPPNTHVVIKKISTLVKNLRFCKNDK